MSIFRTIEFSQEWLDLGIIDSEKLQKIESEWNSSDDKHTEHYRWRAFLDFIESQEFLDPFIAKRLYDLGANDPDSTMGGSMMAHVLRRKDCPVGLLRAAAESEEKYLRRIAAEQLAKESLQSPQSNKRLERTRRLATSIRSCVGEPLKRSVGLLCGF